METLNKIWEVIKRIGVCIGIALSTVALVLIGRGTATPKQTGGEKKDGLTLGGVPALGEKMTDDEIEEKSNAKKNETLERLANTDAGRLAENYGTVCDAITDGKLRFERRCRELERAGADDYADSGR